MKRVSKLRGAATRHLYDFDITLTDVSGVAVYESKGLRVRLRRNGGRVLGDAVLPSPGRMSFRVGLHYAPHTPLAQPKHVILLVQGKEPLSMLPFFHTYQDLASFDLDLSLLTRWEGEFTTTIPLAAPECPHCTGPIALKVHVTSRPVQLPLRRISPNLIPTTKPAEQTEEEQHALHKRSTSVDAREALSCRSPRNLASTSAPVSDTMAVLVHKDGGLPGLTTESVVLHTLHSCRYSGQQEGEAGEEGVSAAGSASTARSPSHGPQQPAPVSRTSPTSVARTSAASVTRMRPSILAPEVPPHQQAHTETTTQGPLEPTPPSQPRDSSVAAAPAGIDRPNTDEDVLQFEQCMDTLFPAPSPGGLEGASTTATFGGDSGAFGSLLFGSGHTSSATNTGPFPPPDASEQPLGTMPHTASAGTFPPSAPIDSAAIPQAGIEQPLAAMPPAASAGIFSPAPDTIDAAETRVSTPIIAGASVLAPFEPLIPPVLPASGHTAAAAVLAHPPPLQPYDHTAAAAVLGHPVPRAGYEVAGECPFSPRASDTLSEPSAADLASLMGPPGVMADLASLRGPAGEMSAPSVTDLVTPPASAAAADTGATSTGAAAAEMGATSTGAAAADTGATITGGAETVGRPDVMGGPSGHDVVAATALIPPATAPGAAAAVAAAEAAAAGGHGGDVARVTELVTSGATDIVTATTDVMSTSTAGQPTAATVTAVEAAYLQPVAAHAAGTTAAGGQPVTAPAAAAASGQPVTAPAASVAAGDQSEPSGPVVGPTLAAAIAAAAVAAVGRTAAAQPEPGSPQLRASADSSRGMSHTGGYQISGTSSGPATPPPSPAQPPFRAPTAPVSAAAAGLAALGPSSGTVEGMTGGSTPGSITDSIPAAYSSTSASSSSSAFAHVPSPPGAPRSSPGDSQGSHARHGSWGGEYVVSDQPCGAAVDLVVAHEGFVTASATETSRNASLGGGLVIDRRLSSAFLPLTPHPSLVSGGLDSSNLIVPALLVLPTATLSGLEARDTTLSGAYDTASLTRVKSNPECSRGSNAGVRDSSVSFFSMHERGASVDENMATADSAAAGEEAEPTVYVPVARGEFAPVAGETSYASPAWPPAALPRSTQVPGDHHHLSLTPALTTTTGSPTLGSAVPSTAGSFAPMTPAPTTTRRPAPVSPSAITTRGPAPTAPSTIDPASDVAAAEQAKGDVSADGRGQGLVSAGVGAVWGLVWWLVGWVLAPWRALAWLCRTWVKVAFGTASFGIGLLLGGAYLVTSSLNTFMATLYWVTSALHAGTTYAYGGSSPPPTDLPGAATGNLTGANPGPSGTAAGTGHLPLPTLSGRGLASGGTAAGSGNVTLSTVGELGSAAGVLPVTGLGAGEALVVEEEEGEGVAHWAVAMEVVVAEPAGEEETHGVSPLSDEASGKGTSLSSSGKPVSALPILEQQKQEQGQGPLGPVMDPLVPSRVRSKALPTTAAVAEPLATSRALPTAAAEAEPLVPSMVPPTTTTSATSATSPAGPLPVGAKRRDTEPVASSGTAPQGGILEWLLGGEGQAGNEETQQLRAAGHEVLRVSRNERYHDRRPREPFELKPRAPPSSPSSAIQRAFKFLLHDLPLAMLFFPLTVTRAAANMVWRATLGTVSGVIEAVRAMWEAVGVYVHTALLLISKR